MAFSPASHRELCEEKLREVQGLREDSVASTFSSSRAVDQTAWAYARNCQVDNCGRRFAAWRGGASRHHCRKCCKSVCDAHFVAKSNRDESICTDSRRRQQQAAR
jgi:hypothetical protein